MNWKLVYLLLVIAICSSSCQGTITKFFGDLFGNNQYQPTVNPFQEWLANRTRRTTTPSRPTGSGGICPDCSCGIPNPVKRIVGGQEVRRNQYPWIAMLRYQNNFYCGGSLINDRYVLTAAHCVRGIPREGISVRLLAHNKISDDSGTIDRFAIEIIEHPDFDSYTYNNDVAVIKLNQRVNFTDILRPICLAKGSNTYVGKTATAAGWGTTSEGGNTADFLREVKVPVISNSECEQKHLFVTSNMLCAGYKEGKKDSCQGDSGGPLIAPINSNKYELIGVISWGDGCAKPDVPGVYARVTYFNNWIKSKTRGACYCS